MCCVSLLLGNILKYTCKISSIVLVLKRKIIYKRGYFATTGSLVVRGCWRHSSLNFQESHVMLRRYICVDLFAERCLHFNRGGSFVNFVANDVTEWPGQFPFYDKNLCLLVTFISNCSTDIFLENGEKIVGLFI